MTASTGRPDGEGAESIMSNGMYSTFSSNQVRATLAVLRHFQAFLASPCREMRDPYEIDDWRDGATRLDKPAAQRKLTQGMPINMGGDSGTGFAGALNGGDECLI